ncbi:MAG: uroporphyrinogen-III synthase [Bacteroidales bacterium]|nr:uroporphyrinogen-III synthase [Bacteroidales bacterium]
MILQGKVFISTVSIHKSVEIRNVFEPLGATVVDFPMTEFIEADQTPEIQYSIKQIEKYQWIIFTSANGVKYFHHLLYETTNLSSIPSGIKIAVVGPKTALELKNTGRTANYTGLGSTAENMVNELIENELVQNCNILFPLGNLAPDTTQIRLSKIAEVTRINVYKTVKTEVSDNESVERIKNKRYDLVLFTSPSGVANFTETLGPQYVNPELRVACIGKVTTKAAEQYGLRCMITAKTSTYEGLANEIINYYYKTKN